MKTLGLIGGMSWESTIPYYRVINERVREVREDLSSAPLFLYSFDFLQVETLQHQGRWDELTERMVQIAGKLQDCGSDAIVICTNTMHMMAEDMQRSLRIPILHIADAAAQKICGDGVKRVGLLGTRFTMEKDFYKGYLTEKHGIEVLIPDEGEREIVHRVIYEELCAGVVREESRKAYRRIIDHLAQRGAEGVVLGCTEISLLISPQDCPIPAYDTTELHARYAADFALDLLH